MSRNLLKSVSVNYRQDDCRIIDNSELLEKKLYQIADELTNLTENSPEEMNLFSEGLDAGQVAALLGEESNTALARTPVHNENSYSAKAEEMLQNAKAEAERTIMEAERQAEEIRNQAREAGMDAGYKAGYENGQKTAAQAMNDLKKKEKQLADDYKQKMEQIEPELVDVIAGVFEHVFNVELSEHKEIIVHLINTTIQNAEGGHNYLVHVSKDDYPYVSMQKKQLVGGTGVPYESVEIVEDFSLGSNMCLIETDSGIYDCSLGTELSRLTKELRLLSYRADK